jgi:hypothetical protein
VGLVKVALHAGDAEKISADPFAFVTNRCLARVATSKIKRRDEDRTEPKD